MKDLRGRKAIVTGGAQGLGLALAEALCQQGVEVCILDYAKTLESVTHSLKDKGYNVFAVQCDLSQIDKIPEFFNEAVTLLGDDVDILVNNAGIHKPMPAIDLPIEDFQKILDVNVTAVFQLSCLAYEKMKPKKQGKIVNIASILAVQGGYNATAYSASKGAVAQLTKSLSNEWAKDGINVNAIAPGYYNTALNQFILNDEERYQSLLNRIPACRFGNPEELAGALLFLASNLSTYVNGIVLPVDGGFLGR